MLEHIKNAVLMVISAALTFMLYGAMSSAPIPVKPVRMCAEFSNGITYLKAHQLSIKKYAQVTGLKYKTVECK
ncbi:TMhelix containing protein [Vibrio phage 1.076.O._10N.286.51.B7]|nr:TMhelix containing protein [Vibrio phage 1.076.O._10N.286.51.B7]